MLTNIGGKGEIAGNQHFSAFKQYFQKPFLWQLLKLWKVSTKGFYTGHLTLSQQQILDSSKLKPN